MRACAHTTRASVPGSECLVYYGVPVPCGTNITLADFSFILIPFIFSFMAVFHIWWKKRVS